MSQLTAWLFGFVFVFFKAMILDFCKNVLLLNPVSVLNTLGLKIILIVYKILKIVNNAYWKF